MEEAAEEQTEAEMAGSKMASREAASAVREEHRGARAMASTADMGCTALSWSTTLR